MASAMVICESERNIGRLKHIFLQARESEWLEIHIQLPCLFYSTFHINITLTVIQNLLFVHRDGFPLI